MNNAYQVIQTNEAIGKRGFIHVYGSEPSKPRPYIISIHGGGWRRGDQTSMEWMWENVKNLGVALVLPSYRIAPEHHFPCAYYDLLHLLAWLKKNGDVHGLDSSRALLLGGSAGGHLCMLLATRAIKENNPMPEIRGVVNYCGVMDMAFQYEFDNEHNSSMTKEFLADDNCNSICYSEASPLLYVHNKMPPVWMAHGSEDACVSVIQSRKMNEHLENAGCPVIYHEAYGLGHTMIEIDHDGKIFEPYKFLFEEDLMRFIKRTLFAQKQKGAVQLNNI